VILIWCSSILFICALLHSTISRDKASSSVVASALLSKTNTDFRRRSSSSSLNVDKFALTMAARNIGLNMVRFGCDKNPI